MTKKRRVSAKQRLELVREALVAFNAGFAHRGEAGPDVDDYVYFVDAVELALNSPLAPRNTAEVETDA